MRLLRKPVALCCAIVLTATIAPAAFADDGYLVRKSMSHVGNETDAKNKGQAMKELVPENEHAFIQMMKFYVPIQQADGEVLTAVPYLDVDEVQVDTRDFAKPLVGVYINGPVEGVDGVGFVGHGRRDAWGAISLDDGETWKNTNLSESADEVSSDVIRKDVKLFKDLKGEYPGDVVNIFHAVAGDKVLVAWPSRYCSSGQPNYSLDNNELIDRRNAIADFLGIGRDPDTGDLLASPEALYLVDMYGVGGQQGSVDYAEDRWEQNQPVGEVPYSCLWTARGQLVKGDDPRTDAEEDSYMRWFNAERLTSGRRDVNRIETQCVEGAGCAITWQEDPAGLRGGQGEGPGEGWSGAIANSQTDIWYSYIDWNDFNVVQDPRDDTGVTPIGLVDVLEGQTETYEALATTDVTQKPKPFVPFAMPMRMTDNAKCNVGNPQPYCYGAALDTLGVPTPDVFPSDDTTLADYGLRDMCANTVEIQVGRHDELTPICVTEDGLPLIGNTASTRPRLNLFGYDSDADGLTDSAYNVVVAEEDKGLGRFGYPVDDLGVPDYTTPCDPETVDNCVVFDIGKNMWYHAFGMSLTDTVAADEDDGLLKNLGFHGNMLNQPEINWQTGVMFEPVDTANMWNFSGVSGDYNYEIYNTEIARRGSLLAQDIAKAEGSTSGLIALPSWKQGTMNQGGPADVMTRRIIIPDGWDSTQGNPYAFRNMACETWLYAAGENPYYPDGLCGDPAVNLSATIPDTCIDSADPTSTGCPVVEEDGSTLTNPVLQGNTVEPNTTKVLSWHQCQPGGVYTDITGTPQTCPDTGVYSSTLDHQSWYNPLDVAKGHRGFLDGDVVMMLYAWSPNWRLNAVGNDRYELYIRRSFDGASTWTTTPSEGTASDGVTPYGGDGTTTCETFRSSETQAAGDLVEPRACTDYLAGAPEQARNVTQHKSMRITTLDPRYTPTTSSITADPFGWGIPNYNEEDVRDPSRFFVVYETGDNTTTAEGEPEPLDLFYSRAINFGDDYVVWAEETDLSVCYPSDTHDQDVPEPLPGSTFCNEFDQMEQGIPGLEASEASLTANPGGEFLYGAWAQLLLEEKNKNKTILEESDAMARRVWWIDGYIPSNAWDFGQGAGDGTS